MSDGRKEKPPSMDAPESKQKDEEQDEIKTKVHTFLKKTINYVMEEFVFFETNLEIQILSTSRGFPAIFSVILIPTAEFKKFTNR